MDAQWVDRYHGILTTSKNARRRLRREFRIIRGLLGDVPEGGLVVDAPCGIGRHTGRLVEAGVRVLAVDLNPHMLRHAVRDARPARALQADVRALPLQDRAADSMFCVRLFHYFDDPADRRAILREAARVARRRIVISFMHPIAFAPLWKARPTRKTQTAATIREDAAACGLRVVRFQPVCAFLKRLWFAALEPA